MLSAAGEDLTTCLCNDPTHAVVDEVGSSKEVLDAIEKIRLRLELVVGRRG
jgi:hypothetical protein